MVAAGTYQLLSRGLLFSITSHCASPAALLGGSRWGLWGAWRAAEALGCHVFALGDAVLGLAVLLGAPWLVYRSGLLRCGARLPAPAFVGGSVGGGASARDACRLAAAVAPSVPLAHMLTF